MKFAKKQKVEVVNIATDEKEVMSWKDAQPLIEAETHLLTDHEMNSVDDSKVKNIASDKDDLPGTAKKRLQKIVEFEFNGTDPYHTKGQIENVSIETGEILESKKFGKIID